MMNIKVNWDKLRKIHENLSTWPTLSDETEITFVVITSDRSALKSVIKFKDFMNFIWTLSENRKYNVTALVAQDKEGRILYRHKTLTSGNEEIPTGGNSNVLLRWKTLSQLEKDSYVRLLVSQIQSYE